MKGSEYWREPFATECLDSFFLFWGPFLWQFWSSLVKSSFFFMRFFGRNRGNFIRAQAGSSVKQRGFHMLRCQLVKSSKHLPSIFRSVVPFASIPGSCTCLGLVAHRTTPPKKIRRQNYLYRYVHCMFILSIYILIYIYIYIKYIHVFLKSIYQYSHHPGPYPKPWATYTFWVFGGTFALGARLVYRLEIHGNTMPTLYWGLLEKKMRRNSCHVVVSV